MDPIRVAILTVSDGVARGEREDRSGAALAAWAERSGYTLVDWCVVPDETTRIVFELLRLCDSMAVDVLLTTGGTGLTERDVTPEATRAVHERDAPGIAEAIRAWGANSTPYARLSRGMSVTRGKTLIVNLPGSAGGVQDALTVLDPLLPHAVQLLRGVNTEQHVQPNG